MMKVTKHRMLLLPKGGIEHGKIDEAACITVGLFVALGKLENHEETTVIDNTKLFFPSVSSKQGNHILFPDVFHSCVAFVSSNTWLSLRVTGFRSLNWQLN